MKPLFSLTLISITVLLSATTFGQKVTEVKLNQGITLQMPKKTGDLNCGTRGACVTWNPLQKKYYAAFAGNGAYPFAVFNADGDRISSDTLACQVDVRGLWFNPISKQVEGNGYNTIGWFRYQLDPKGDVKSFTILNDSLNQPDPQSVGAFDVKLKKIIFFFNNSVYFYSLNGKLNTDMNLPINLGITKAENIKLEDNIDYNEVVGKYNVNAIVYTGLPGAEYGVLNAGDKAVELYDAKTGYLTKKLMLPVNASVEYSFNFAYANGMVWLFDMEHRAWIGYK